MFDLKIDSFYKAHALMEDNWPTKMISLIAPDEDRCAERGVQHLLLRFHDTDVENDQEWSAPTREHVRIALNHTQSLTDDDRLLVHCTAGKSRSTAIAIGALIQHGMKPEEAFEHVKMLRPNMIPNRLIIRYLDEELNLGGELISISHAYYKHLDATSGLPLHLLGRHTIDD